MRVTINPCVRGLRAIVLGGILIALAQSLLSGLECDFMRDAGSHLKVRVKYTQVSNDNLVFRKTCDDTFESCGKMHLSFKRHIDIL